MDCVNIILACDRSFRMQLAVCLASIVRSFSYKRRGLSVYIFSTGLSQADRTRVERVAQGRPISLHWLDVDASPLAAARLHGHVSLATYYRILAFERLARDADRALYLDCDLVVRDDLNLLWDIRIPEGCALAAVQDSAAPFFDSRAALGDSHPALPKILAPLVLTGHAGMGIPPASAYFNAGVLMVDLAAWRRLRLMRQITLFMEREWKRLWFWDQDALNGVLWNRWHPLPARWNVMPSLTRFHGQACPFPWPEVSEALRNPAILHYAAKEKPWHREYRGPYAAEWQAALADTPWAGWKPGMLDYLRRKAGIPARYLRDGLAYHWRRLLERARRSG